MISRSGQPADVLDVAVVILNYRTAELVLDCLASLLSPPNLPQNSHIVVVDGASGDNSVTLLGDAIRENGWQDRVSFLPLEINGGFSYGNNRGIEHLLQTVGRPRFIHLLNPDTLARPGCVQALVEFMDRNPGVGIAGSRLEDPDGMPQACAFRFPSMAAELESEARTGPVTRLLESWRIAPDMGALPARVDWVSGASLLFRTELLDQIGLLDQGYFLYYEEVDYCFRARQAGWQCWHVPESRVVHLIGQSTGVTRRANPSRRPSYWFDSRHRFYLKHHGALYAAGADAAWVLGHLVHRMRLLAHGHVQTEIPFILKDFVSHAWSSGWRSPVKDVSDASATSPAGWHAPPWLGTRHGRDHAGSP